jgi:hypothetical protein
MSVGSRLALEFLAVWGGQDLNLRPTNYESVGARSTHTEGVHWSQHLPRSAQVRWRLAHTQANPVYGGNWRHGGGTRWHLRPDELERRLKERLDALGPAPGAELLHVLMLPDFERADRIGGFWEAQRRGPSEC